MISYNNSSAAGSSIYRCCVFVYNLISNICSVETELNETKFRLASEQKIRDFSHFTPASRPTFTSASQINLSRLTGVMMHEASGVHGSGRTSEGKLCAYIISTCCGVNVYLWISRSMNKYISLMFSIDSYLNQVYLFHSS